MFKCKSINNFFKQLCEDLFSFKVKILKPSFYEQIMKVIHMILEDYKNIEFFKLTQDMLEMDNSTHYVTGDGFFDKNTRGLLKEWSLLSYKK